MERRGLRAFDSEHLEQAVLATLAAARGPVGCTKLRVLANAAGWPLSEATAGRILRRLDESGLTARAGTKSGRVLLPAGRERLAELQRLRGVRDRQEAILDVIDPRDLDSLRELLAARRVVERETARLAAIRASASELDELEKLVERHMAPSDGVPPYQVSMEIHRTVARLSGNRILAGLLDLLVHRSALWALETLILTKLGARSPSEHRQLLEALQRRDPDEAERVMGAHLDRILAEVERYGQQAGVLDLWEKATIAGAGVGLREPSPTR